MTRATPGDLRLRRRHRARCRECRAAARARSPCRSLRRDAAESGVAAAAAHRRRARPTRSARAPARLAPPQARRSSPPSAAVELDENADPRRARHATRRDCRRRPTPRSAAVQRARGSTRSAAIDGEERAVGAARLGLDRGDDKRIGASPRGIAERAERQPRDDRAEPALAVPASASHHGSGSSSPGSGSTPSARGPRRPRAAPRRPSGRRSSARAAEMVARQVPAAVRRTATGSSACIATVPPRSSRQRRTSAGRGKAPRWRATRRRRICASRPGRSGAMPSRLLHAARPPRRPRRARIKRSCSRRRSRRCGGADRRAWARRLWPCRRSAREAPRHSSPRPRKQRKR